MRKAQLRKESLRFIRQALIACREEEYCSNDTAYGRCLGSISMASRVGAISLNELELLLTLAQSAANMAARDRRAKPEASHAA
ncbi:hypothetical protein EF096_15765 [Pseudomonas neustonica]|jgi:hypothetical protein|uniref:DUF3077 domain-containing protein n=1 Tax=Pseudomonas neustonica TaxID=2487346 RepID=A0ABX9XHB1_9PSED|nr:MULTISPECIES: hypothetical protein [Pseudomonas]ROZ80918.1 hypothetical protein EF099_16230 [Pseudomonas sp. SSM44]ROZ82116.1 hypothetical protein EF096_15765 [Pseudomonas neustonica]|tara:strand:- start:759 stop:1007 length:249 start_codon:yes stop_codon:yes gene_type:complete